jgi:hypothetical protein
MITQCYRGLGRVKILTSQINISQSKNKLLPLSSLAGRQRIRRIVIGGSQVRPLKRARKLPSNS